MLRSRMTQRLIDMQFKKRSFDPYLLAVILIVAGATLLRFLLIAYNWPSTHSDESVMDLIALHIAYRGEHPTFYYGQNYMGPIEAYMGAPLFRLFGVSIFSVRLGLLLFHALFLLCMYALTSMIYNRRLALFTILLLSLGSSDMLTHQLLAIGGYPEILFFATLLFVLVVWLSLSASPHAEMTRRHYWWRVCVYAFLGCIIGFSLWDDQLILLSIATAGVLLLIFNWRELLGWPGVSMIAGFLVGALPLIVYNLKAKAGQTSLDVLLYFHTLGAKEVAQAHITFWQKLQGVVLFSLPITTGVNPCDRVVDLPLFPSHAPSAFRCTLLQGSWSFGLMLLWATAVLLAVRALWSVWRHRNTEATIQQSEGRGGGEHTEDAHGTRRYVLIRQSARLLLLLSAMLFFLSFLTSNIAALFPVSSARYLVGILSTLPALLWPLWKGLNMLGTLRLSWLRPTRLLLLCKLALLVLIATTFLFGTIRTFEDIPRAQRALASQEDLTQRLLHVGATRLYTDYWTCYRIIFQSQEKVLCAVLLHHDRYQPYVDAVQATPHPAFLFPLGSPDALYFAQQQKKHPTYRHFIFDGYELYQYSGKS